MPASQNLNCYLHSIFMCSLFFAYLFKTVSGSSDQLLSPECWRVTLRVLSCSPTSQSTKGKSEAGSSSDSRGTAISPPPRPPSSYRSPVSLSPQQVRGDKICHCLILMSVIRKWNYCNWKLVWLRTRSIIASARPTGHKILLSPPYVCPSVCGLSWTPMDKC